MDTEITYAGIWERFWALVIDVLLFCAVFFPVTRIVKGVWIMSAADHRWANGLFITDPLCLIFLAVMVLTFVLLEGLFGATVGKWVLGLRVVGPDGGKPGLARSAVRNLLRLADGLPAFNILGVILILRSPQRARFGDRVADTRVVRYQHNTW
ncbi:MAG: RDD family protein [Anaerolineae bacterium]